MGFGRLVPGLDCLRFWVSGFRVFGAPIHNMDI